MLGVTRPSEVEINSSAVIVMAVGCSLEGVLWEGEEEVDYSWEEVTSAVASLKEEEVGAVMS